MTDERLAELERLATAPGLTPPPWTAHYGKDDAKDWEEEYDCNTPDDATGGYVFRMDPEQVMHVHAEEEPEPGQYIVPDNGIMVAGKRAVNRGYDLATGEPEREEWIDLKPHDAALMAAAREGMPELVAEVRRLTAALADATRAGWDQAAAALSEHAAAAEQDGRADEASHARYFADRLRRRGPG